jgi:hypothetical protein
MSRYVLLQCICIDTALYDYLQVKTFREEFKLEAVAVNSAHGGCTKEIMAVSY